MNRQDAKVLVTGGRDYNYPLQVKRALDALHVERPIMCVIHGGARGADAMAERWAEARNVMRVRYSADWKAHGRKAGPLRNAEMVATNPTVVLAFPGGKGTADCVRRARAAGIPVIRVGHETVRWPA